MTAEELATNALADVAANHNKHVNYLTWFLTVQAFLKAIAGAAAFGDLFGNQVTGVMLVLLSAVDTATATYLARTGRNPDGSATSG